MLDKASFRLSWIFEPFIRFIRKVTKSLRILRLEWINRSAHTSLLSADGPVVSLTTYGQRANTVHIGIESIGQGTLLPSRLILWLDDLRFFHNLPPQLERLKARGLEVKLCQDRGPHKKYYPYVESQDRFEAALVTADDDVLYPRDWLEGLVRGMQEHSGTINCYRAKVISLEGEEIAPYAQWEMCASSIPSVRHVATGCSGIIYPPEFLYQLKRAGEAYRQCCPRADDLWLHVQAVRAGFRIRQITEAAIHFPTLPNTQRNALYLENAVVSDGNDQQIRATYTRTDIAIMSAEAGNRNETILAQVT